MAEVQKSSNLKYWAVCLEPRQITKNLWRPQDPTDYKMFQTGETTRRQLDSSSAWTSFYGILSARNFLTSQMERTTTKSKRDLYRIVMYLEIRRAWFKLSEIEDPRILLFVDAAYACRNDAKSHICGIRQEIEEGSIEMPYLQTGEMLSNHAPNVPAKEINC